MPADLKDLETRLGYEFRDRGLLIRALTHKSRTAEVTANDESFGDNEQLEFLGDSVLGFLASDYLMRCWPALREGRLSKLKAHMVSATCLHGVARTLGLGEYLLLGKGEERSGGRSKKALLANALEAVLAAIYLDGGMTPCRRLVEEQVAGSVDLQGQVDALIPADPKSSLQEYGQARGLPVPRYHIIEERGPEHAKVFTVEARLGKELTATGEGTSKKAAAQRAAEELLNRLRAEDAAGQKPESAA